MFRQKCAAAVERIISPTTIRRRMLTTKDNKTLDVFPLPQWKIVILRLCITFFQ